MKHISNWLNSISLKRKLLIIQIFCVIVPLIITDAVIVGMVMQTQRKEDRQRMIDEAGSITYTIYGYRDEATSLLQDMYMNKKINEFNGNNFSSSLDYYEKYYELNNDTLFSVKLRGSRFGATVYSSAEGVINGGRFRSLERAKDAKWYEAFNECQEDVMLFLDFSRIQNYSTRRTVSVIRKLDYFNKNSDNLVKIDFNYADIDADINNLGFSNPIYICYQDDILFTNVGKGGIYEPYYKMDSQTAASAGYVSNVKLYDKVLDIYIMRSENKPLGALKDNLWIILFLVALNIAIPALVMSVINRSFSERLNSLTKALKNTDNEELVMLPKAQGQDEIGLLMESYNNMADRINNLIQNEYKEKLLKQENDLARQRAELLALHSQINPHFLFNALESIRMHSVIKNETETASMVEKLALMQRQNVDWGNDFVSLSDEVRFVEAYLELQKYRFGNKLNYVINIDEDCQQLKIPKITLVTFVENACVHGMEKKTSGCWIFVRGSREYDELVLEVEDTGNGISEEARQSLLNDIENVDMKMLQESRRVGILNAALRLKMFTQNRCHFEIESEPGAGTMVIIRIPVETREESKKEEIDA